MRISAIEKLVRLARKCEGFDFFYDKVSDDMGISEAENIVSMEFRNLKTFYEWAVKNGKNKTKNRINADKKTKTAILHPEVQRLKEECEILQAKLSEIIFEHDELVFTKIPNLNARYLISAGSSDIELYRIIIEVSRLKRTIELIQASINRGKKPDIVEIEVQLETEFREWEKEIKDKVKSLENARKRFENSMSDEESVEFKQLYRTLVKKLHPDLNREQTENEKNLWLKLQKAYQAGDMDEMKLISILLSDSGENVLQSESSGIEEWTKTKNGLNEKIDGIQKKIDLLKSQFPCSIQDQIFDEDWVATTNEKTRQRILEQIEIKKSLTAQLDNIKKVAEIE